MCHAHRVVVELLGHNSEECIPLVPLTPVDVEQFEHRGYGDFPSTHRIDVVGATQLTHLRHIRIWARPGYESLLFVDVYLLFY